MIKYVSNMAKYNGKNTDRATAVFKQIMLASKKEHQCKNNQELADLITPYIGTDTEITGANIQCYTGPNPNLPSIEKLQPIAAFLGYSLDEFFDKLFEPEPTLKNLQDRDQEKKHQQSISATDLILIMKDLPVSEQIHFARIANESVYNTALITRV